MSPARDRRPRLSWFRFYADDFLGGTGALTAPEVGQYVLLLLQQWSSGARQVVPSEPERLQILCRGKPSPAVLAKFEAGPGGLRNARLAEEWAQAHAEYQGKARHGMSSDTAVNARRDGYVAKALREAVLTRDGNACLRCQSRGELTVDHVVPSVLGGETTLENLQTLCRSCNSGRPVDKEGVAADLAKWGLTPQIPRRVSAVSTRKRPPTKNQEPRTITTENERIAEPPAPPITLVDPPWSREACDDWIARFEGTAPGGPIGRHLKPLVEKYGWPPVRAAWRAYLAETESQFANPARFAATYGTWKRAPAAPAAPPEPPPPPADPEAYQFFDAMKLRLSGVVPLQSHATWLRPVDGRAWEGACLVLACPSKEHAAQMRAWSERLRSAAKELGYPGNERDSITFRTVVIREPEYLHDGSIR